MNNIKTVNKLNHETLKSIIKIGDDNFANGYFTKEYLMTYLNDADSFVLVYLNHEKVIGFSIATIWNTNDLFTHTEGFHSILTQNGIRKEEKLHLGVIKTIAIDLDFQRKGVGTELFIASEKKLEKLGVKSLVVPAWVYNGLTPIGKMLDKFHYKPWFCLEKFWLSVCDKNIITCPKKRENRCQCDSYFYKKESDD